MSKQNKFLFLVIFFHAAYVFPAITAEQNELLKNLPEDQRSAIESKIEESNKLEADIKSAFEDESILVERPENKNLEGLEGYCDDCIFGYDLFRFSPSTFAPANSVPISSTYTLGPGDKLKINYFGIKSEQKEEYISRDGTFDLPGLGPVAIAGLTFDQASSLLQEKVEKNLVGTSLALSLSELRSINIYILGEAYKPGSYTVSSLSTVTNALYVSGGASKAGSLRDIQIKRDGKTIKNYDLYDLLLRGDSSTDFRLEDGDTVFIPFIENRFTAIGAFKRPAIYEFKPDETIADGIKMAGGFNSQASSSPQIEINKVLRRTDSREIELVSYLDGDLNRKLVDGYVIGVSKIGGLKSEYIELSGEFVNPGSYSINPGDTLLDIIDRAGGYNEWAYSNGAVFTRTEVAKKQKAAFNRKADDLEKFIVDILAMSAAEGTELQAGATAPLAGLIRRLREIEPVGRQVIKADLLDLKDPFNNIRLSGGDKLYVPGRPNSISVVGEVFNLSTLKYNPNVTLEEYIQKSGGFTAFADKSSVFIIKPNGESVVYRRGLFKKGNFGIMPGSTIVVSRKTRTLDAVQLAKILAPIASSFATSIAAISILDDS